MISLITKRENKENKKEKSTRHHRYPTQDGIVHLSLYIFKFRFCLRKRNNKYESLPVRRLPTSSLVCLSSFCHQSLSIKLCKKKMVASSN